MNGAGAPPDEGLDAHTALNLKRFGNLDCVWWEKIQYSTFNKREGIEDERSVPHQGGSHDNTCCPRLITINIRMYTTSAPVGNYPFPCQ